VSRVAYNQIELRILYNTRSLRLDRRLLKTSEQYPQVYDTEYSYYKLLVLYLSERFVRPEKESPKSGLDKER